MNADPAAVDKDLGGVGDGAGCNLLQVLHAPLLQELEDGRGRVPDAHVGHEGEVLDQTHGPALGRLGGANHAPQGVVQLTRLGEFSVPTDGRVDAT